MSFFRDTQEAPTIGTSGPNSIQVRGPNSEEETDRDFGRLEGRLANDTNAANWWTVAEVSGGLDPLDNTAYIDNNVSAGHTYEYSAYAEYDGGTDTKRSAWVSKRI